MTLEKREQLLNAGFFPVNSDYWSEDGFPFKTKEEHKLYTWARKNRYTNVVQPYSERYINETAVDKIIEKALRVEEKDAN